MPTTDTAIYIGAAGCVLADGTPLIPSVTVAHIPSGEANASDLWQPVAAVPATALPMSVWDGGGPLPDTNPGTTPDGGTP